jgi:hypothetical protein
MARIVMQLFVHLYAGSCTNPTYTCSYEAQARHSFTDVTQTQTTKKHNMAGTRHLHTAKMYRNNLQNIVRAGEAPRCLAKQQVLWLCAFVYASSLTQSSFTTQQSDPDQCTIPSWTGAQGCPQQSMVHLTSGQIAGHGL